MQLSKTHLEIHHECLKGICLDGKGKCISKTASELWAESDAQGKSIYQTGLNPDKNHALHRMEADRLENNADNLNNLAIYAMIQGDHHSSMKLMSRAEEMRSLSAIHRRQANL